MREHLIFSNSYGKALMGSGSYILTSVDGINRPDLQRQEQNLIDTDGKRIVQTVYTSKTITVTGYIRAFDKAELRALKLNLMRILDCKTEGILEYDVDAKKYYTEAIPTESITFGEEIQNMVPFTVSFDAYNIYWKSVRETQGYVYERVAGIPNLPVAEGEKYAKFQFPCVFSTRTNKKSFVNKGTLSCDFICTVKGVSETGAAVLSAEDSVGFQIINNTTGDNMVIDYDVAVGETVTVNTADFSITSDKSGNLLHKLHLGSDFFKLAPGKSEIEVINFNTSNNIVVEFTFHETYKEV